MNNFKKYGITALILLLLGGAYLLFSRGEAKEQTHQDAAGGQTPAGTGKSQNAAPGEAPSHSLGKSEKTVTSITTNLPVFSITTDPENLWSEDKGIYMLGKGASKKYPYKGANYWKDWEIPVDLDYMENGKSVYKFSAGLKIFGGETRTLPQKSFALYAKNDNGNKTFDYSFFPEKQLSHYKTLVLRNGGQDFNQTHFRDSLASTLVQGTNNDAQAYRPVVVYLNGDYWGIYDLREKIDKDFLAANHNGVKKKDMDLLESNALIKEGSNKDYLDLVDFIKNHDLSNDKNYQEVVQKIEVKNYIDYIVTELYIGNTDWPSHNYRYWKANAPFDKWRWIIYDSDLGFGDVNENTVDRLYDYKGKGDDTLYISYLFRELLKNKQFRNEFKQRSDELLATTFAPDQVVGSIEAIRKQLEPEMPEHVKKWGGTVEDWEQNVSQLKDFAQKRPEYLKQDLYKLFNTFH
ncbi:CotH kinase family protein [Bacillus paramycoides]|uniref:CotH kinase family protein n=1 Tax=Bacillus paramycoides TaxID=2026194 RepID=A0ABU6N0Y3_9BACI|nr:CotH kinase family protein [Bacillus paramycoides]